MLAKSDKYIQEAADSIYELTQDEKILQQCEAREDYRRRTAGRERMLKEALEEIQQISEEKQQISEKYQQLSDNYQKISEEMQRLQQLLLAHGIDMD